MDEEIDTQEVETEEEVFESDEDESTTDNTTEESKDEKPKETLEQRRARLQRELKKTEKKLGIEPEAKKPAPSKKETSGLDDTQLDYLDLKGISDQEDIDVIEKIMTRTGQSLREVLKDDYVVSKLDANKAAREVQNATPGSTKRSNAASSDNVALAVARFEKDGVLPDDFALRSKVVDAIEARTNNNAPSWH